MYAALAPSTAPAYPWARRAPNSETIRPCAARTILYGVSFLLLHLLLGQPGQGRGGWAAWFLLSTLVPTGLELVTG